MTHVVSEVEVVRHRCQHEFNQFKRVSSFNSKLRRPLFKSGGELSHRFVFYASSMIVSMSVSMLMSMSVLVSVALSVCRKLMAPMVPW